MVRPILTPAERERGRRLGAALRAARGHRSMVEISEASGVPVETLRKIETGRIATPAFFTVAALAKALELDLVELAVDDAPRQVLERVDHAADRAWVGGSLAARSAA